ncbi:hypothetical protein L208DRAFT_792671 [Tricholoma matsutake]|nr:hypothetical protein L208DRAFT_792671 [Tricholoma matsutake 945]
MEGTAVEFYNGDYTTQPTSSDTSLHFYPFDQLPIVESHVYPHYVIYNLGEKLRHLFGDDLDQSPIPELTFPTFAMQLNTFYASLNLTTCYQLYKRWMGCSVPTWFIQGKGHDEQTPNPHDITDNPTQHDADTRMTCSRT